MNKYPVKYLPKPGKSEFIIFFVNFSTGPCSIEPSTLTNKKRHPIKTANETITKKRPITQSSQPVLGLKSAVPFK